MWRCLVRGLSASPGGVGGGGLGRHASTEIKWREGFAVSRESLSADLLILRQGEDDLGGAVQFVGADLPGLRRGWMEVEAWRGRRRRRGLRRRRVGSRRGCLGVRNGFDDLVDGRLGTARATGGASEKGLRDVQARFGSALEQLARPFEFRTLPELLHAYGELG